MILYILQDDRRPPPPIDEKAQDKKKTSYGLMKYFKHEKPSTFFHRDVIPSEKFTKTYDEVTKDTDIIIEANDGNMFSPYTAEPIGYLVCMATGDKYFISTVKPVTIQLTNTKEKFMEELQNKIDPKKRIYGDVRNFTWTLNKQIRSYPDLNSRLKQAIAPNNIILSQQSTEQNIIQPTEQNIIQQATKQSEESKKITISEQLKKLFFDKLSTKPDFHRWSKTTGGKKTRKSKRNTRKTRRMNKKRPKRT